MRILLHTGNKYSSNSNLRIEVHWQTLKCSYDLGLVRNMSDSDPPDVSALSQHEGKLISRQDDEEVNP
jgi:hypothetical protein